MTQARSPRRRGGSSVVEDGVAVYFAHHAQAARYSMNRLTHAPLASVMTIAVIAVALALPTGLFVLVKNLQSLSGAWSETVQISLFLDLDTTATEQQSLAAKLRNRGDLESVQTVSPEQAIEELRALSSFGEVLEALDENPLPPVLIVHPDLETHSPETAAKLVLELEQLPGVDRAQLDMQWLQRLHALMDIAQRAIAVIALLLAAAVLLVVGNTIRLDIESRREEIVVNKLVGATDGFIRRPFLYGGLWYGLAGGATAVFLVEGALLVLANPTERLAHLYASAYHLVSLDFAGIRSVIGLSIALGLAGAWLAVGRHLKQIEPR